jgi:Restriction endonuclease NotI
MTKVAEIYGVPAFQRTDWPSIAEAQRCPFLERKCLKNRKSEPDVTIGTCLMHYGRPPQPIVICPHRLLDRGQIFTDCLHLLSQHEPGNELRILSELTVPGGSVDHCLVSVRDGKPRDFVAIEIQTLDTTGTVWPERQRFLSQQGVAVTAAEIQSAKPFGMNWKMTAKTTLMQLNHKVATFERIGKRLVLVLQHELLDYMRRVFAFQHVVGQRDGDAMQFHAYELRSETSTYGLRLKQRVSTDAGGVAECLGLQANASVDLVTILHQIEARLPQSTLLTIGRVAP